MGDLDKLDYALTLAYSKSQQPDFFNAALKQYRKDGRFPWGFGIRESCMLEPTVPLKPSNTPTNRAFVSHTACLRAFEMCGYNVVTIGPEMERAFTETTLENVPLKHIKSPWKSLYVNLLDSDLEAWGGEIGKPTHPSVPYITGTGWHKLKGVYVTVHAGQIHMHYVSHTNAHSVNAVDSAQGWFGFSYCENPSMLTQSLSEDFGKILWQLAQEAVAHTSKGPLANMTKEQVDQWIMLRFSTLTIEDLQRVSKAWLEEIGQGTDGDPDKAYHFAAAVESYVSGDLIPREGNLESWLDKCISNQSNDNSDWDVIDESVQLRNREMMRKLFRIVLNAILYMNAPSADIKRKKTSDSNDTKRIKAKAKKLMDKANKATGRSARRLKEKADRELSKVRKHGYNTVLLGPSIESTISQARTKGLLIQRKGHVRKGHWHLFRVGRRVDDNGERIPLEKQGSVSKWVPPCWVGDLENLAKPKNYQFKEPRRD